MDASTEHISFVKLSDLAEDQLSESERRECSAHISICMSCADDLKRLRNTIELMRTDTGEDAPQDLIRSVVEIFRSHRESDKPLLRRISAVLSFDSVSAVPAYGLRSVPTTTRQLIYSAEDYDVDLRLTKKNQQWVVRGQILGEHCRGAKVEVKSDTTYKSAVLNELCEFTLTSIPDGYYVLRFELTNMEIEVLELKLGM